MNNFLKFDIKDKIVVRSPQKKILPLIVSSPHSGRNYPPDFVAASALTPLRLRSSEDSFVEDIFSYAPDLGASLIQALFPRVFVDVNRQPYELDPTMFSDPLPHYVTTQNSRISAGLGTIARVVSNGERVYKNKLTFQEAEERINHFYRPYHDALQTLINNTKDEFGYCILLDCHSMPSGRIGTNNPSQSKPSRLAEIVLGDCHGTSCHPHIMKSSNEFLTGCGFSVRRNIPYAGGFITRNYGKPKEGVHALQIELNRALYMDEQYIEPLEGIKPLRHAMTGFMEQLGNLVISDMGYKEAAE
ncbi:MAG: N-formylglutamate amidohydrolase [Alphaproteobacteria bacterium]|nr:N-formylglutamate amidohydrolase [Alphaproteobacteria bacterium]